MSKKTKTTQPTVPSNVFISNGDDWEGFYIDGELVCEDHKLNARTILNCLGIEAETRYVSFDYLGGTVGQLPAKLSDIPADAFTN